MSLKLKIFFIKACLQIQFAKIYYLYSTKDLVQLIQIGYFSCLTNLIYQ